MEVDRLKSLYQKFSDELFYFCLKHCRSEDLAFDLMQETFLRADRYYGEVQNERAWLYKIAYNLLIDNKRKEKKYDTLPENFDAASPEVMEETVHWNMLRDSIVRRLSEENKIFEKIFLMRVDHELTHNEISEILNIPFRTVRRHFEKIRNIIYQDFKWELNLGDYKTG